MQKKILRILLLMPITNLAMQQKQAVYHQNYPVKNQICCFVPSCCLPEKLPPEAFPLYVDYKKQYEPALERCSSFLCKHSREQQILIIKPNPKNLSLGDLKTNMDYDSGFKQCLTSATWVTGCYFAVTAIIVIGLLTTISVKLLT
jgi:hypothetical protein